MRLDYKIECIIAKLGKIPRPLLNYLTLIKSFRIIRAYLLIDQIGYVAQLVRARHS